MSIEIEGINPYLAHFREPAKGGRNRLRQMNAVDLTGRHDHIAQPLTIQIASHMNHHPVGQFDPHAAAMA